MDTCLLSKWNKVFKAKQAKVDESTSPPTLHNDRASSKVLQCALHAHMHAKYTSAVDLKPKCLKPEGIRKDF